MRGSFSVEYKHPDHPDNICAVDWDHWVRRRWLRSWKSTTGAQWYQEDEDGGSLGQIGYDAILDKFGLQAFRAELPMERVEFMSPSELVSYRKARGLPYVEILSDTPGSHLPAEEYD